MTENPGEIIVKTDVVTRRLECKLDEVEVDDKVRELARATRDQHDQVEVLQLAKEKAKAETEALKEIDAYCFTIAACITDGREVRSVECDRILDYTSSRVFTRRQDTRAIISVRNMNDHELQMGLPGTEDEGTNGEEDAEELAAAIEQFTGSHDGEER